MVVLLLLLWVVGAGMVVLLPLPGHHQWRLLLPLPLQRHVLLHLLLVVVGGVGVLVGAGQVARQQRVLPRAQQRLRGWPAQPARGSQSH